MSDFKSDFSTFKAEELLDYANTIGFGPELRRAMLLAIRSHHKNNGIPIPDHPSRPVLMVTIQPQK